MVHRPTEQAHLAMGWRGFGQDDPDRYGLAILNHVLGGGMSSRLFQEVREKRGLVYSIYSFSSLYADAGALHGLRRARRRRRSREVLSLIEAEVDRLLDSGVTEREREVALGYLEGSFVLGLEDSGSRMARIGKSEVSRGEIVAVDEHIERLRAVTARRRRSGVQAGAGRSPNAGRPRPVRRIAPPVAARTALGSAGSRASRCSTGLT